MFCLMLAVFLSVANASSWFVVPMFVQVILWIVAVFAVIDEAAGG